MKQSQFERTQGDEAMNDLTMETLARRLDRVEREMEGKRGR